MNVRLLRLFFTWGILLLLSSNSRAQSLFIEKLSAEKGLSHQNITCLLQDRRGFLWVGTQEGLLRYDGYFAIPYEADPHNPEALPSNEISSLYQDPTGTLWVGTSAGLSRYHWEGDHFETFNHGLPYTKVKSIAYVEDAVLCIGTQLGGIYRFDMASKAFTALAPNGAAPASGLSAHALLTSGKHILAGTDNIGLQRLSRKPLGYEGHANPALVSAQGYTSLFKDKTGNIWAGSFGSGLAVLSPSYEIIQQYTTNSKDPRTQIGNGFVNALAQDIQGNMWIGTSSGIAIASEGGIAQIASSNPMVNVSALRINALLSDTIGIVWIGTDNGLYFFDPFQEKFYAKGREKADWELLGNLNIQAIAAFPNGNIVLGTQDGLALLNTSMSKSTLIRPGGSCLSSSSITALATRGDKIWVGTENAGLIVMNADATDCRQMQQGKPNGKGLSSNHITGIITDEAGAWIASEGGGINRWHAKADSFTVFRHSASDSNTIAADYITCIAKSKAGAVWVGSYGGGIDRIWEENNVIEHYKSKLGDTLSLNSNLVTALFEDSKGVLWVGTQIGLSYYDADRRVFRSLQLATSKSSCLIKGITEDGQGNIWVSSNLGILKYDRSDSSFEHYDEKDGIISKQFNENAVASIGNGVLAFGCTNGLVYFTPENIYKNRFTPPVYITQVHVNNQIVPIAKDAGFSIPTAIWSLDELVLGPNESFFSFEFAALNMRLSEKNRYRYKLEPLQKEWIYKDASKREAAYTNLPPGEYTFMVQGSNNDGLWNEKVTQIKVTIVPPIWKTWWMRTIFASLAILLFWWIYQMRVRRIEKSRRELEEKVEMRTQELVEKSQELAQKADELEMQKEEIMQINDQLASINEQLGDEKKKSEEMLLNILPRETAKELQEQGFYTPRHYQLASVLFTDFKSFTSIAESMTPKELIEELDYFFQYFDAVVEKHNLEKIKTIGDAYMCAGGIPKPNHTNAVDAVLAGLEIVAFTQRVNEERLAQGKQAWELRVGINSGELVAGVVGKKKFAYDIWGDAVNLASRMESSGEVGKVNISQGTYELVKDFFVCTHRGRVHAKGKGDMDMYIVEAIKPELSLGNDGLSPNAQFREMVKEVMMKANSLLHNKEEMQNFPTPLFIKARKYVEQLLTSKLPAHVVYHNWPHTWEVTEAAIEIGIAEGVSDAELEQLAVAALFHDTGHTVNYESHEEFSLNIMRQFLEKEGKPEAFIQNVTDIINATRMPQRPHNVMQRIMCDADLFYLTSELFEEKSQLLRQEWEAQFSRTYTDHAWITQNIAFLESHQYFTNYGKTALEPKKTAIVSHQKELLMQA